MVIVFNMLKRRLRGILNIFQIQEKLVFVIS